MLGRKLWNEHASGLPPILPRLAASAARYSARARGIGWYVRDWRAYRRMPYAEPLHLRNALPCLTERVVHTPFDSHYFFQDIWAARHVAARAPHRHVDVGSRVDYVGFLTAFTRVTFVDIRPLDASLEGLEPLAGSVLEMPFDDRSVPSLSCLNVAEHIGLGRYGDPLEPLGTRRAAAELQRVLAPGGQLLFSLPVGRPRVLFNSHRIHAPDDVVEMFDELQLAEFSAIDDYGAFSRDRELRDFAQARFSCGLFRFARPGGKAAEG